MKNRSKAYSKAFAQIETGRQYTLRDAVELARKISFVKFDETIRVNVALGVDPKHADQNVRGTVVLPHGTGKIQRILAIVAPDKEEEAKAAGADIVGGEDVVNKIKGGWLDFEIVITTPDMMRHVGQLGKVLGPRGLMPNPKVGTVTTNISNAVREIKAGRLEFKVDKYGLIALPFGKRSFKETQLFDNLAAILDALFKAKPSAAKGNYMKSITVAPTMGPGIRVDPTAARNEIDAARGTVIS